MQDIVSPEDGGAVGDGSTDDDSALDKVEAGHDAIFLPNRSYKQGTDTSLAAEYYGPGHILMPQFAFSPMRRGVAKALTPPDDFDWTPPILPRYTAHGWRGNVTLRSLRPALGSVAYYVDVMHGADGATGKKSTITGITQSNPAVVTYSGTNHPTNGNQVYINDVEGMDDVNGKWFTVANVNTGAGTFELSGVDSSGYDAYTSGGNFTEPFRRISTAIGKTDATVIYVAPGVYNRDRSWGQLNPATSNDSLCILPWEIRSGSIQCTMSITHDRDDWENDGVYTNLWKMTRSLVAGVRDYRHLTADGEAWPYELAQDKTDCNNRRGTWYTDGTDLWVHTFDDSAPDELVRVFLQESGVFYTSTKTIYIEGIEFHGGRAAFEARNTSGFEVGTLYAKDCKFLYSWSQNGLEIEGLTLVVLENCEAAFNAADGFNYHANNGISPKVVEINCRGHHNGTNRAAINNGSTGHDEARVVRIGGEYWKNEGPNVVDVGDCLTWNVGVFAHDSRCFNEGNRVDFYVSGAAGKMWLYDCTADGTAISLVASSGATMYADRLSYNGTVQATASTVAPYVQE